MSESNGSKSVAVVDTGSKSVLSASGGSVADDGVASIFETFADAITEYGNGIPAYGSRGRDKFFRKVLRANEHLLGAHSNVIMKLTAIPFSIATTDPTIKANLEKEKALNLLFNNHWARVVEPFLYDVFSQDNGGFIEILDDDTDEKEKDPGTTRKTFGGFKHWDSAKVTRTGDPLLPYKVTSGKGSYDIHVTRMFSLVGTPDPESKYKGAGHCSVSRCIESAITLGDLVAMDREMFGDRPISEIITFIGGSTEELNQIIDTQRQKSEDDGITRYSRQVRVGLEEGTRIERIPMKILPDGFNHEIKTKLVMWLIAKAYGMDARDVWENQSSGATKGDSEIAHIKTAGRTPAWFVGKVIQAMRELILPLDGSFEILSDFRDDTQDESRAKIHQLEVSNGIAELTNDLISTREYRRRLVVSGRMSKLSFEEHELEDGRLHNGDSVLMLFYSRNEKTKALLNFGVDNPLDVDTHESEVIMPTIRRHMLIIMELQATVSHASARRITKQCHAAMSHLLKIYEGVGLRAQMEQAQANNNDTQDEDPKDDEPETSPGDEASPENVSGASEGKAVKVAELGEILAWDDDGTIITTGDVDAALQDMKDRGLDEILELLEAEEIES